MSGISVFLAYGAALALALFLLYRFQSQTWYWHVLSAGAALLLGLIRLPAGWQRPAFDLVIGSSFILLFAWGLGGVLMYGSHRHRHA